MRDIVTLLAVAAAAACASAGAAGTAAGRAGSWSATLRPAQTSGSGPSGSILLTPSGARGRTRVDLSVTAPSLQGTRLAWAVYPGACGAAGRPVIAATDFPSVDVGESGTGVVRSEVAFVLDPAATYHVDVYRSGGETGAAGRLLCANLAYGVSR